MENNNQSKLSKWLETLQQESWQLELVISGFAIFLVGSLGEPLDDLGNRTAVSTSGFANNFFLMIPMVVLQGAWFFLLINLILHVILRGLWISTIGLRYVSGDIDWESLKLHAKFDKYLRKNVGSYDEFIERLEKLCSVVFAFTFMIVFILVAFGLWFCTLGMVMQVFMKGIIQPILPDLLYKIISRVIMTTAVLTGLLYFFDFLTLGWLKRKKWASKIYYPFYRLYSFITLASLYRPIYYNLIDHKYGRNLAKLLIPYIFILLLFASIKVEYHPHYPTNREDSNLLQSVNYDDERANLNTSVRNVSIPSKYVSNGFLEVFVEYSGNRHNKVIEKICPDLKPLREIGIQSDIIVGFNDHERHDIPTDSSLLCVQNLYQITVDDSLFTDLNYRFFRYPKYHERGLKTIIDVDYLPRGEHLLKVDFQNIYKDSLIWEALEKVPFWKE